MFYLIDFIIRITKKVIDVYILIISLHLCISPYIKEVKGFCVDVFRIGFRLMMLHRV